MKNSRQIFLALVTLFLFALPGWAAPASHPALSARFDREFLLALTPLNDVAVTLKAKWASQKDISGPMLAVFWHEWCGFCKLELEECTGMASRPGLSVIGISLDRDEKLARTAAAPYAKVALFHNKKESLKKDWQMSMVPFTFILDKSLTVRSVYTGMNDERWGLIEKRVSMVMGSEAKQ